MLLALQTASQCRLHALLRQVLGLLIQTSKYSTNVKYTLLQPYSWVRLNFLPTDVMLRRSTPLVRQEH
jgi:hypothetical protein